jgi:hypothetical protein
MTFSSGGGGGIQLPVFNKPSTSPRHKPMFELERLFPHAGCEFGAPTCVGVDDMKPTGGGKENPSTCRPYA